MIWVANQADVQGEAGRSGAGWRRAAYGLPILFFGAVLVLGLLLALSSLLSDQPALSSLASYYESLGAQSALTEQIVAALPAVGAGLALAALGGTLLLLPAVRRAVARLIPIDPQRLVHAVALSFTMLIVINMVVVLAIGLNTLTEVILSQAAETETAELPMLLAGLWIQQGMMALWALIGVGWLSRRSLPAVLARLELRRPEGREITMGLGGGMLALLTSMLIGGIASALGLGIDPDVQSLNEVLLGPLIGSIPGILTIGLAAALGEETLFRGALQPRFGIVLTTLLFAITHNQYGLSLSTVVVFFAGLIFALLRQRFNTTTSMIAHAAYNTSLGLLALLAAEMLQT
jgi:membrane protease YdiL (CAAX protease family)